MNARSPYPVATFDHDQDPRALAAIRSMRLLVGGYLSISALTLVAIVLLRNDASVVNAAVWIRGIAVVASAAAMFAFTVRAVGGSRPAFRRVRIISAAMVVAIAVIIALPGTIPLWMKIEQAACGLILVGVIVVVNGKPLRSLFAAR